MVKFEYHGENGQPTLIWRRTRPHQKDYPKMSCVSESTDVVSRGIIIDRREKRRTISVDFVSTPLREQFWGKSERSVAGYLGDDWGGLVFSHPELIPRRTHHKRRIAKKYLKRYGAYIPNLINSGYGLSFLRDGDTLYVSAYVEKETA